MRALILVFITSVAINVSQAAAQNPRTEAGVRSAVMTVLRHDPVLRAGAEIVSRAHLRAALQCDTTYIPRTPPHPLSPQDSQLRALFVNTPRIQCHFATGVQALFTIESAKLIDDTARVVVRYFIATHEHGIVEILRTYVLVYANHDWTEVSHKNVSISPM